MPEYHYKEVLKQDSSTIQVMYRIYEENSKAKLFENHGVVVFYRLKKGNMLYDVSVYFKLTRNSQRLKHVECKEMIFFIEKFKDNATDFFPYDFALNE